MLAGDPPFSGSTAQAIVARVLTENPRSLSSQRHTIPAVIESAVFTALEKLPADRFASATEFAAALRGEGTRDHHTVAATRQSPTLTPKPSRVLIGLIAGGMVIALGAGYFLGHTKPASRPLRASLPPPPGCTFAPVSLSNLVQIAPDGSMVAFIATCGDAQALWIRNLVSGEVRELAGTSDALYPFWAPDSRSLGFFTKSKLRRIDLQSGAVRDLAAVVAGRGGSWSTASVILYAPDISGPLYQVPAEGGKPELATVITADSAGKTHRLPYFLPDGRNFLFAQGDLNGEQGTLRAARLGSTESHILLNFPSNVAYAAGRLLYVRDGLLMAQRFDPGNAKLSGSAVSLIPGLETWPFKYLGNFSTTASTDLLVYQPTPVYRTRVNWFDPRSGRVTSPLESGSFRFVRVSPKGDQILFERGDRDSPLTDVWLYQTAGQGWTRITSHPEVYYDFAWSPDGKRIGYGGAGDSLAYIVSLDRSSTIALPIRGKNVQLMLDWSPDGSFLAGWEQVGTTGFDLIVTPLVGGSSSRVLYSTPGNDVSPRLSPDGKLLAFISDQSGRNEAYVTRMPDAKAHWQVSSNGAQLLAGFRSGLAWGRNGRELYFVGGDGQLASVTITDQAGMNIGRPVTYPAAPRNILSFDTAPDGRLVLVCDEAPGQLPLSLVEHWPALLAGGD